MATKKFYENYEHIVTPTSKNVVLEYKGDYSVYFDITVDISGKNATKYYSNYENVSVKNGDDLIVKTIFISNSGSPKTVTTTIKDYFTNPYFDNNFTLESNLLKNQTYTINPNTEIGTNGLYSEKGDYANSSDFILAPKYDNEQAFNLKNNYDDFVYDEKGKDNYVITSSSGRDYFLEMSGNDKYSASNGSNPYIEDLKGNDEYVAENNETRMKIYDYSGNDKYEAKDSAIIITNDYKGNDEYIAQDNGSIQINDNKGNDKYWLWSHSASWIVDSAGNDSYDLLNAVIDAPAKLSIVDYKGNDKFSIKKSSNIQIIDASGADKYEILNGSNAVSLQDYSGNDKYDLLDSEEIGIIDGAGNDKYKYINMDDCWVEDSAGNDKYTVDKSWLIFIDDVKGNDSYKLTEVDNVYIEDNAGNDKYDFIDSEEIEITDKDGNDKYNLQNLLISSNNSIKDENGNDSYTIANSWDVNIQEFKGNDKYSILTCTDANITDGQGADSYTVKGSYNKKTKETTYVKNIVIEDGSIENDTYYFDKVYGVPEVNTISDEGGSDKYSIKDTMFVSIKDNNGNDKYSFNGQIINTKIDDLSGIDTYSNNSKSELKCIVIDDKGADNDTYKLNNVEGTIKDEGGDNTFAINGSVDFYVTTSGLGNDKYTLQNRINGYIKDYDGEDTYTSKGKTTLWSFSITDSGTAADTYTLNGGNLLSITDEGGNNKFTISNCLESGINATGNGNDTYKYTNMSDCWIEDSAGNDNYNINKSWLSNIEDYAGSDVYKITNTESGYITDNDGDDTYKFVNSKEITIQDTANSNDIYSFTGSKTDAVNVTDFGGDDKYTIEKLKYTGHQHGQYHISDYTSGTDSLTISGLSSKNVMYLGDFDKNGDATGDLIILDTKNKGYVQIDQFFSMGGGLYDEFDEGMIETIKAGKTTLNIDEQEMVSYLNSISYDVASWLSSNGFDNVCKLLNEGSKDEIGNFIAYMTES